MFVDFSYSYTYFLVPRAFPLAEAKGEALGRSLPSQFIIYTSSTLLDLLSLCFSLKCQMNVSKWEYISRFFFLKKSFFWFSDRSFSAWFKENIYHCWIYCWREPPRKSTWKNSRQQNCWSAVRHRLYTEEIFLTIVSSRF